MNKITILRFVSTELQRGIEVASAVFLLAVCVNVLFAKWQNSEIIRHNGLIVLGITLLLAILRWGWQKKTKVIDKIVNDILLSVFSITVIAGTYLLLL